jgi:hypothetical protein
MPSQDGYVIFKPKEKMENLDSKQSYLARLKALIAEDKLRQEATAKQATLDAQEAEKQQSAMNEDCDCREGCDGCDEDTSEADYSLSDMVSAAEAGGDPDEIVKALSMALMVSAKQNGWVNLSASAHSIWVES